MKHCKRLCLVVLIALVSHVAMAADGGYLRLVTGGTGGVYYPLGQAIVDRYQQTYPETTAVLQASRGSVDNLHMLHFGVATVGMSTGDTLRAAWDGTWEAGIITHAVTNLRGVGSLHRDFMQIVARADSGIAGLEDLRGRRVSVGPVRSGTELEARVVTAAQGLSYDDFGQTSYLSFNDAAEAIRRGELDAAFVVAGLGSGAVHNLAEEVDLRVVPVPHRLVRALNDPLMRPGVIPAGTYRGQAADVETLFIPNFLVTNESADPELIYRLTRLVYEDPGRIGERHPAGYEISAMEALTGLPVPLHPGAERYFRERGILR